MGNTRGKRSGAPGQPAAARGELGELSARGGLGALELLLIVVLFAAIFASTLAIVESGRRPTRPLEIARAEGLAQEMLFRLERELSGTVGAIPATRLLLPLEAGERRGLDVEAAEGFPPAGVLLLDGPAGSERVSYGGAHGRSLRELVRGIQCTAPLSHPAGTRVLWSGLAEPLHAVPEGESESPRRPDGTSLESGFETPFRGDGTGFSFRVPLLDGPPAAEEPGGVLLGARLEAESLPTGWMALVFRPASVFDEAQTGTDVNDDGDRVDLFDVGYLARVAWDTAAADPRFLHEVELGPTAILQEQCNWGGDLDGDGHDDPMFLWNPDRQVLRVRLFLIGRSEEGSPIVRRVSATLLLRSDPELE